MNMKPLTLSNLLTHTTVFLIYTHYNGDTTDYIFQAKIRGLRMDSPLRRKQTDRLILHVYARRKEILSYHEVSNSTSSKIVWRRIIQDLDSSNRDLYIKILFDLIYGYANKRKILTYQNRILQFPAINLMMEKDDR